MNIQLHRIYEDGAPKGYRVLVERLWPRGVSKEEASLDAHWKDIAPSNELRKWFSHDAEKWGAFRNKYLSELSNNKDQVKALLADAKGRNLVLLYGSKDKQHNSAQVLKDYLHMLG